MTKRLPLRRIHLDFHTSPAIGEVGQLFDPHQWQDTLAEARVASITCFSLCHHGMSYHPTQIGRMHPSLHFNLLRAQMDAAHEVGIEVPVYLSAGANEYAWEIHPEWDEQLPAGVPRLWGRRDPLEPGFHKLCLNSPYLDYLCALIRESVTMFPDADGIFLDIVLQSQCCCPHCLAGMAAAGLDPCREADRRQFAQSVLERYYREANQAARTLNPAMPVFHNSGDVSPADRKGLTHSSHLELESLPTGGWGYDHFPQSAAFARTTGLDICGMTGKFHSSWGEFGGFKHPNALRYECMAMLANGAGVSVGDQLHPSGRLDPATYNVVGEVFRELESKEVFCRDAESFAEVAVVPREAFEAGKHDGDIGAARLLLEGHFLFDIITPEQNFERYRMVILSDDIPMSAALEEKCRRYMERGGKLVLSGESGVASSLEFGARIGGAGAYFPTYCQSAEAYAPSFCASPWVIYGRNRELWVEEGESLGEVYYPYFNRDYRHFCSHQHAPNRLEPSGCAAGVRYRNLLYFAWPVFAIYRQSGAVTLRQFVTRALRDFFGPPRIECNLPGCARMWAMCTPERWVIHLVHGTLQTRGGGVPGVAALGAAVPLIEDEIPLIRTEIILREVGRVIAVTLEPEHRALEFQCNGSGCRIYLPEFTCHAMIVAQVN